MRKMEHENIDKPKIREKIKRKIEEKRRNTKKESLEGC